MYCPKCLKRLMVSDDGLHCTNNECEWFGKTLCIVGKIYEVKEVKNDTN